MKKKDKKQLSYRNISCDSDQEVFFLMWAFELLDNKIVSKIERSQSFILSEPLVEKQIIQLKTKNKEKDKTILHGHSYTPEFVIKSTLPDSLLTELFRSSSLLGHCWFEIKPQWDQNNMTRLFKINQKWMYEKYKIFVNLVKPVELFEQTFTPKDYLKTATGKNKKINFEVRTFEEWITTL